MIDRAVDQIDQVTSLPYHSNQLQAWTLDQTIQ